MSARKAAAAQTNAGVVQRLSEALDEAAVRIDERSLEYFAADALGGQRGGRDAAAPALPIAVIEPCTTEELSAVMRICHDERIPVTPYGAGSGLMGGARSLRAGIV